MLKFDLHDYQDHEKIILLYEELYLLCIFQNKSFVKPEIFKYKFIHLGQNYEKHIFDIMDLFVSCRHF